MELSTLIEEGEKLSKLSLLLTTKPTENSSISGIWGGKGQKKNPPKAHFATSDHWITVDCNLFSQLGLKYRGKEFTGSLSLYEQVKYPWAKPYYGAYNPNEAFYVDNFLGKPLYSTPALSFPPIEVVCLHGSQQVESWLSSLGRTRFDYREDDGPDDTEATKEFIQTAQQYYDYWSAKAPLFNNTQEYVAVLGGWPMSWPDDDFFMPPEVKFILMTIQAQEPWLELWNRGWNFWVTRRIT